MKVSLLAFRGQVGDIASWRASQHNSNTIELIYPLVECLFNGVKNWSMYSQIARRARV